MKLLGSVPPVPPPVEDGVGQALALGVGVAGVALGVVLVTEPVQTVPLRVNWAGTGFAAVQEPLNPNVVVALVPIEPL